MVNRAREGHHLSTPRALIVILLATIGPATSMADVQTRISTDASVSYGGFGTANALTSVAFERLWHKRLSIAVRVGVGFWPSGSDLSSTLVTEETLEIGIKLQPSRSVGLLLGWRAGHSYFKKRQFLFEDTRVSTLALEPITRLSIALDSGWSFRFMPFTMNFYKSRVWGLTVGSEVGFARRF